MRFRNEQRHESYDGGLYHKLVSKLPYFTVACCSLWAKKLLFMEDFKSSFPYGRQLNGLVQEGRK